MLLRMYLHVVVCVCVCATTPVHGGGVVMCAAVVTCSMHVVDVTAVLLTLTMIVQRC